jgi:hypothetical protein
MVSVTSSQLVIVNINTPVTGIVTSRTTGNIAGITVATVAGQVRISNGHIMMLLLVCQARSMAILAIRDRLFHINFDCIMTVGTGQGASQHNVVTISGFSLMAIVTVERAGSIGMAGSAISHGCCRSVVNVLGCLPRPVIIRIVAAFTISNRLHA